MPMKLIALCCPEDYKKHRREVRLYRLTQKGEGIKRRSIAVIMLEILPAINNEIGFTRTREQILIPLSHADEGVW